MFRTLFLLQSLHLLVAAYTSPSRWGQAVAVINDALYVQGGMTDQFNSYSYTTAPINDDLLYLPLSSSFDPSSPPWQLLNSSSQGPVVAWHTVSAYNDSQMLAFGGLLGPDSTQVLPVRPDSAWLLDVSNRDSPVFAHETSSWANQPDRRMRHSAISNRNGQIFIVGGEKADGSQLALSDHYVFNPFSPNFTRLPSDNGPGGITGHASVILPNGTMLVFGGYDQPHNQMVPFSTIWTLDTTAPSYSWSTFPVQSGNLPTPRRAFAYVLIEGGKILIQGGCSSDFQTTYPDGWILDLAQNPLTWTQVPSLSQVGQRRDHFAVAYGSEVIFGFGYGPFGPASASLQVYNPSDGSYSSTYTPPSSPSQTQTIPVSTPTSSSGGGGGQSGSGNGQGGNGNGNGDSDGSGDGSGNGNGNGNGGGSPQNPNNSNSNGRTTAIAVGATLGVLGALIVAVVVIYYVRRNRLADKERRFMLLHGNDDMDEGGRGVSPHLEEGLRSTHALGENHPLSKMFKNFTFAGALTAVPAGVVAFTKRRAPERERRDMLADEDTREFAPWYAFRRGSSWSLRSAMRLRSREPSTGSYYNISNPPTPWAEKNDPFSDGAAVMRDGETGYIGAAAPGHGGIWRSSNRRDRDMSYGSTGTDYSYTDPFADPYADSGAEPGSHGSHTFNDIEETSRRPYPRPAQPLQVDTLLPISVNAHTLSPVTEASRGTISQSSQSQSQHSPSVSSHTNSNEQSGTLSPFDTFSPRTSSISSFSQHRPSSLIDSANINYFGGKPVRRSDSWWNRFSKTSLLDRRGSGSRHGYGGMPEIRDPNPPPRLVAIEESQHSASPENDSPNSAGSNSIKRALSKRSSKIYRGGQHGKSLSSLRTADSDAIERMAGMDVAQRERTGSHGTRDSSGVSADNNAEMWLPEDGRGDVEIPFDVTSPTQMTHVEAALAPVASSLRSKASASSAATSSLYKTTPSPPASIPTPPSAASGRSGSSVSPSQSARRSRRLSGDAVAARVRAFEQMSTERDVSGAGPSTGAHPQSKEMPGTSAEARKRKASSVNYGLVPRPSLFVANPDHSQMASGDSKTSL